MADIKLSGNKKVGTFCREFKETFGCTIRVYNGVALADDNVTLASIRKEGAKGGELVIRGNMQVGNLEKKIMDMYGIRVQIANTDNSALADDSLTIAAVSRNEAPAAPAKEEKTPKAESKPKTDNAKVNAEAEALRKELEAAQKAKAEAEAAKAEAARLKAEAETAKAEAAKAEAARLKAEAEKKKAEKEAEKLQKNTAKADAKPAKSNSKAGALPGVFSVGENKKICFSQGSLQFNPAKYEFRFAKNQYEVIPVENNKKVAPNYDGWIDRFGWGTSGFMGCQPTEISTNNGDYGPQTGDIAGTNYDWGVYNPISNGGNKEGLWRTPTKDEWEYLMTKRPNADKLRVKCTVCGVEGYFIFPDDFWNNRLRLPLDMTADSCSVNQYNADQWAQLESLGVVFMPKYIVWLSTTRSTSYAFVGRNGDTDYWGKSGGYLVRLIKDIK